MARREPSDRRWIFGPVLSGMVQAVTPEQRESAEHKSGRAPNGTHETRFETSSER